MQYNHDISGTSYIKMMEEKTTQYNNLIRKAERISHELEGKPSKEEATFYYQAAKVCEEIVNLNISQRAVYSQWKYRKQDCEENVKRITNVLAPPPPPAPVAQPAARPASEPVRKTIPNNVANQQNTTGEAKTQSGFTTRNACKDVTAETIERWFKDKPKHNFSDVSGMEELRARLIDEAASLGWDLVDSALSISPVQSYFFYGPPGTGKTYIIEAFASELMEKGFKFIRLLGGDIHASLVGVAEKTVQIAFQEAIDNEPCLIFVDEIENVCVSRDQRAEGHEKRLTVAFLEAYNLLRSSGKRVIFMGATNHPGMVDEAMLDRINLIKIPLPTEKARASHFKRAFGSLQLEPGFTVEDMAAATDNYSYRDLGRLKETTVSKIKAQVIAQNRVTDGSGVLDQSATDVQASDAIRSGKIVLTRALFEEAQRETRPSDKTKIREELEAFEESVKSLNG